MSISQSPDCGVTMVGSGAGASPSASHPRSAAPEPATRETRSSTCVAESHETTTISIGRPELVSWSASLNSSAIAGSSPGRIGWLFAQCTTTTGSSSRVTTARAPRAATSATSRTAMAMPTRFTSCLQLRQLVADVPDEGDGVVEVVHVIAPVATNIAARRELDLTVGECRRAAVRLDQERARPVDGGLMAEDEQVDGGCHECNALLVD